MAKLDSVIYDILKNSDGHMTAEEVFIAARNNNKTASIASVYRILNKLADTNKIQRIQTANGSNFFDITLAPHDHVICSKCGAIKDIHIHNLKKQIEHEIHVPVESYSLCINYICEKCRK